MTTRMRTEPAKSEELLDRLAEKQAEAKQETKPEEKTELSKDEQVKLALASEDFWAEIPDAEEVHYTRARVDVEEEVPKKIREMLLHWLAVNELAEEEHVTKGGEANKTPWKRATVKFYERSGVSANAQGDEFLKLARRYAKYRTVDGKPAPFTVRGGLDEKNHVVTFTAKPYEERGPRKTK